MGDLTLFYRLAASFWGHSGVLFTFQSEFQLSTCLRISLDLCPASILWRIVAMDSVKAQYTSTGFFLATLPLPWTSEGSSTLDNSIFVYFYLLAAQQKYNWFCILSLYPVTFFKFLINSNSSLDASENHIQGSSQEPGQLTSACSTG